MKKKSGTKKPTILKFIPKNKYTKEGRITLLPIKVLRNLLKKTS